MTVGASVSSASVTCDTSYDQLLTIGCQPKGYDADRCGIVVYDDRVVIYNFTKQQTLHTLT